MMADALAGCAMTRAERRAIETSAEVVAPGFVALKTGDPFDRIADVMMGNAIRPDAVRCQVKTRIYRGNVRVKYLFGAMAVVQVFFMKDETHIEIQTSTKTLGQIDVELAMMFRDRFAMIPVLKQTLELLHVNARRHDSMRGLRDHMARINFNEDVRLTAMTIHEIHGDKADWNSLNK